MKIKSNLLNEFKLFKEKNSDPYGSGTIAYAERWAEIMEKEIESGKSIIDVMDRTSHEADIDGITGYMYGMSVNILAKFWEFGETLRQAHNLKSQIGTEGEEANKKGTVLNPAVIVLGSKEQK